jgi:hypothetical protein
MKGLRPSSRFILNRLLAGSSTAEPSNKTATRASCPCASDYQILARFTNQKYQIAICLISS